MIDHVLGRPSSKFRKVQVIWVIAFWLAYLGKGNPHGPPGIRRILKFLYNKLRPTIWQTIVSTMLYLYFARNFSKIFDLESPEPLAGMYSRSFFRATYVLTALDAGFWTAMRIKNKMLRDFCSILFSGYYLIAAEAGDEKVRRVRACITYEHLRVSWNKTTTPYISFLTRLVNPHPNIYPPRHIKIERPAESYYKQGINAWIYFEGTREELANSNKLLLDLPGGGFIAMSPRNHEDKLMYWSRRLKVPVLSIDYKKAPEYPYPYALHECYDVYSVIIASNGKCIGFSGENTPQICLVGDSAGGNLAAGVILMIIDSMLGVSPDGEISKYDKKGRRTRRSFSRRRLPMPEGVILIYPCLDMNITSWVPEDTMRLIRERSNDKEGQIDRNNSSSSLDNLDFSPPTESPSTAASPIETPRPLPAKSPITPRPLLQLTTSSPQASTLHLAAHRLLDTKPASQTSLAMTSRLSYVNDRVLTPEMMRAMVLLYIGPHHRPDFATEYLLSPIVAPEEHLALFPKCYFLTGERDPLVDDTVVFAGRISEAKRAACNANGTQFKEEEHLEVKLLRGVSHGFLMMGAVYAGAEREMERLACWVEEILGDDKKVKKGWDGAGELMGRRMGRLAGGVWGSSAALNSGKVRGKG